jgi:hypothetical protein
MPSTNEKFNARFNQLEQERKQKLIDSLNDDAEVGPTTSDWLGLFAVIGIIGAGLIYLFGR